MGMLDNLMALFMGPKEGDPNLGGMTDRDRQMQAGLQRMKDMGMPMGYPQRRAMGRIEAKGGGFRTAPKPGGSMGQGMLTRKKVQEASAQPRKVQDKWDTGEDPKTGRDPLNRDWGMSGPGGELPSFVIDKPHKLTEIMDQLNPAQRGMAQWIMKMNPKQLEALRRKAGRGNITPSMIKSVIDGGIQT